VRIKCAECADYDSCVHCFSVGATAPPHQPGHAYRVVDDLSFPLFDPAWGADEELLLLEAVSIFGVGAWPAVAEHVGAKGAAECREHYEAVYLASPSFPEPHPLPSMAGVDPRESGADRAARAARRGAEGSSAGVTPVKTESRTPAPVKVKAVAAAARAPRKSRRERRAERRAALDSDADEGDGGDDDDAGDGSEDSDADDSGDERGKRAARPGAPARTPPHAARGVPGASPSGAPGASPLASPGGAAGGGSDPSGYHAKRDEHDPEYDNDAELLISEVEFRVTDTPAETAEKLRAVDIYNARLDAREARRAWVVARGLTDGRKLHADDRRTPLAERDLASRLRALARFLAPGDAAALAAGALHESRLRARIAELMEARVAGARTLADADLVSDRRRRRGAGAGGAPLQGAAAAAAAAASQRAAAEAAGAPSASPAEGGEGGGGGGSRPPSAQPQPTPAAALAAAPTPASGTSVATATPGAGLADAAARPATSVPARAPPRPGAPSTHALARAALAGLATAIPDGRSPGAALAAWRARTGVQLDLVGLPGVDLLSSAERALCAGARLLPAHYVAAKAAMLATAAAQGGVLSRAAATDLARLDAGRARRVLDLAIDARWLAPHPDDVAADQAAAAADAAARAAAEREGGGGGVW
jgi:transcriptional adapter 2-alpha